MEGRRDCIDRAADHLRLDTERIDDASYVDDDDRAVDPKLASFDRHFERVSRVAAEREVARDADAVAVVALDAPAGALGAELQDARETARVEVRPAVTGV